MKKRSRLLAAACGVAFLTFTMNSSAQEQEMARTREYKAPNPILLTSGVGTLGLSYIPAVVAAMQSDREADNNLYIPVVGPWLDLGMRDSCNQAIESCDMHTTYKALLVTDGIFQGLGALQILAAFVFPEQRTERVETRTSRTTSRSPKLRVSPATFGTGSYGLVASGVF